MTIYLDITRLITWKGSYTGMERFAYEITKGLINQEDSDVNIKLCYFTNGQGFQDIGKHYNLSEGRLTSDLVAQTVEDSINQKIINKLRNRIRILANNEVKPIKVKKDSILLIYDGLWNNDMYVQEIIKMSNEGVTIAHVVHDLAPIIMPHVCYDFVTKDFTNYFNLVAPHIDILLSISKNTERDFINIYGNSVKSNMKKIILRHGDNIGSDKETIPKDVLSGEEFILSVGSIEIRKNHFLLYETYRLAVEKNIELPKLYIVGKEGWLVDGVMHSIKYDPAINSKITILGPISNNELGWLYRNCLYTIFPSVYEGWGLPVAESLSYNKLCICSNSSSIPEIGGDLNLYFSPYNSKNCLDIMISLKNKKYKNNLESKITKNYKLHTWQSSADKLMASLKVLA